MYICMRINSSENEISKLMQREKVRERKTANMSESEESVFSDGYEPTFSSDDHFHGNQCFEQSNYDNESGSKRIRLSPESTHQEGDCEGSSPLGLRLKKTPSFLNLLQSSLSKGKQPDVPAKTNTAESMSEKLKASNFPAVFIRIGSWQRLTRHEGDLTAKLYYAKRKLVWEVLDGALKSKVEIQWSDIIAIRAVLADNEPGVLEIDLNQPPLFFREINPQPRKHTLWQQASDFTGGQAPICRRHCVTFQPGVLDKHYEKLLQCDKRLHDLSRKPFPSHESPYFDPTMFGLSEFSLSFNRYGAQYPYQTYPTIPRVPPLRLPPNPSTLVMGWGSNNGFVSEQETQYASSSNHGHGNYYQASNLGILSDMERHLLGDQDARTGVYLQYCHPREEDHSMVMQPGTTNSLPAFLFPGTGDFFSP